MNKKYKIMIILSDYWKICVERFFFFLFSLFLAKQVLLNGRAIQALPPPLETVGIFSLKIKIKVIISLITGPFPPPPLLMARPLDFLFCGFLKYIVFLNQSGLWTQVKYCFIASYFRRPYRGGPGGDPDFFFGH